LQFVNDLIDFTKYTFWAEPLLQEPKTTNFGPNVHASFAEKFQSALWQLEDAVRELLIMNRNFKTSILCVS